MDVYFQKLRSIHRLLVFYHHKRGRCVRAFDFDCDIRAIGWARRLIDAGRLERVYVRPYCAEHGEAIDQVERTGAGLSPVAKKCLLERAFEEVYLRRNAAPGSLLVRDRRFGRRAYYAAAGLAYLLAWALVSLLNRPRVRPPRRFRQAVPLEQPFQIKFEGRRSFDFLIDGETLRREETLFLLRFGVREEWTREREAAGFRFLRAAGLVDLFRAGAVIGRGAWAKAARAFLRPAGSAEEARAAAVELKAALYWAALRSVVRFDHYIYTNQEHASQIALNEAMREDGVTSWYYSLFFGGSLLASKEGDARSHRHILWAYLNCDRFLGINEDAILAMKAHPQSVGRYEAIGSVFSQLVRETEAPREAKGKVISFFDTTFIDSPDCPTTYEDALGFYSDALRFLEARKDVRVIFKPSKGEAYFTHPASQWASPAKGRRLVELWDRLKAHPRVEWAGDAGDTAEIMAKSDVVVTHCFSSPTVEALGARRKAVWYETGEKFRGFYYDRIPGLVLHGYRALEEGVDRLLNTSEADYDRWLDERIRGRVEAQLDGRALTRLREAVAKEAPKETAAPRR